MNKNQIQQAIIAEWSDVYDSFEQFFVIFAFL